MYILILQQLGIALILGTLVGLEREKKYQMFNYHGFGGVRTFALVGLLGALTYILGKEVFLLFPLITGGFLFLIISAYMVVALKHDRTGLTSEIGAILVYLIGVLCAMDKYLIAMILAVSVMTVLHFKDNLHSWAKHLRNEEILSTIEFMIIAFVVLPLLPNENFGPYGFFNPYVVWLMVVFISGISFVSYIAMKVLGEKRGITLTGFLAGLISSTALTLSFSAQSKKNKGVIYPYVIAIVVASSAMFFRILFEVAILNRALLADLYYPMITMGVIGILSVCFIFFRSRKFDSKSVERNKWEVKSPFSLIPALKFGLVFAFVLFLSRFAIDIMGNRGLYLTSFVSGLVDVDAITVSMANLAKSGVSNFAAVTAITIAAITNTLIKGVIFFIFGNKKVALKIMAVYLLMLLGGGVSMLFID